MEVGLGSFHTGLHQQKASQYTHCARNKIFTPIIKVYTMMKNSLHRPSRNLVSSQPPCKISLDRLCCNLEKQPSSTGCYILLHQTLIYKAMSSLPTCTPYLVMSAASLFQGPRNQGDRGG